ncbi:MAG: fructose bisphosphate aldolase [Actinomycetota bacterium]
MNVEQKTRIREGKGFIAALDQSGGSTPKALRLYGVSEDSYSGESEMFDLIHGMRSRMITSPAFDGRRVLGAILFEGTMERDIQGVPTADFLWTSKKVVPFLKVDKGLNDDSDGVQTMKSMPQLPALLEKAVEYGIFGTKMRSVIKTASASGIRSVVAQQFDIGRQILSHGLVPIIEPEIDIHSADKSACEQILLEEILSELSQHSSGSEVMLKLTLPEQDAFYQPLVDHEGVLRVVALSGGYSREEANSRLSRNPGVIASFSRALTEGLTAQQSDAEFNATLDRTIEEIYQASST